MNKIILSLIILFCTQNISAQYLNMDETRREYDQRNDLIKTFSVKRKAQKIKSSKAFVADKKHTQLVLSYSYEYNQDGKITARKYYDRKGAEKNSTTSKYDVSGNCIQTEGFRKGKPTGKEVWEYDSNGNNLMHAYYGANGISSFKYTCTYDSQNNLVGNSRFDKSGKLFHRYEYDYYADGSRKETRWFDKKNKLSEVYTYECSEVGKTEKQISRDTSKYCIRYEVDADGNKVKISEVVFKKHHGWLSKTTTDSKGNILKYESIKPNGKVDYKFTAKYNSDNFVVENATYRNGIKLSYSSTFEYDAEGKNLKSFLNPGTKNERVFTYEYEKY